jgi:hypothetical protein
MAVLYEKFENFIAEIWTKYFDQILGFRDV